MLFWYLFDRISGGSILLGTYFGVCAYNKWWHHYWDQECLFLHNVFANLCQNILYRKGPHPFGPVATQYYELRVEPYALNSQRSQLFNASKISSQLALEAHIKVNLCRDYLNNFPGPEKCLKRNGKHIFRKAVSNLMFRVHESVSRFRDAILRIAGWNHMQRKERERSFPMRQKSAPNSLWMALWRQKRFRTFW